MEFGDHLKQWRSHRHMSQMDLALEAGISSRHLSFLETGRARPSEGMTACSSTGGSSDRTATPPSPDGFWTRRFPAPRPRVSRPMPA